MLLFVFVRELFKFVLNTPAFDPLFQLPPRYGDRYNDIFPNAHYLRCFIYPPIILPISFSILLHTSYFLNERGGATFGV